MSIGTALLSVSADARYAARALTRSPGFTAVAVLTLAVGIGGTTALFSLADAVLFRPLPFYEPHRLIEVWGRNEQRTGMRVPVDILNALRTRATTLQVIGTHDPSGGVLSGDHPIQISGETVSANFVDVFGVHPIIGRAFMPDDERAGAPPVMLVSYAFWQQQLGAHPNVAGRTLYLDATPYIVVGVMPPGFTTSFAARRPSFWTPYAGNPSRTRERELGYEVVARLAPGITIDDARREIDSIASSAQPDDWRKERRRIGLVSLREEVVGDRAYALQLLLVAAALLLATACANVAQLLLARSDQRIREFATRKAIGAGDGQLFRLALFESLWLSSAGGVAGVAIAHSVLPIMLRLAPTEIPRLDEASIDVRVLTTALAITMLTGCLFGVMPALRLSRLSVVQAIKPAIGAASRHGARFRSALVVMQVAVAVVLSALAGLVVQTFLTLLPTSPGFATDSRAAFSWFLRESQFPDPTDRRRRVQDWMDRLEATPGIAAAAFASSIAFADDDARQVPVRRPDDTATVDGATLRADLRAVSANFFAVLRIPIRAGRHFAVSDRAEAPRVAIVNETLARKLEPSSNVIGHFVRIGAAASSPMYEIVGVVANTRWWGMTLDPLNEIYTPLDQDRASFGFVVVQSQLDAASATDVIAAAFHDAFPGAALPAERRAIRLEDMIARSVARPRFAATVMGAFSLSALVLAALGLFGLVAYSVSQRRQEFGLRVALGATSADLLVISVRWAAMLTAIGIVSGLAAAAYLTRFIASQLYAIEPRDLPTFAIASFTMLVAAVAATYLPARRAAHADPIALLRYE